MGVLSDINTGFYLLSEYSGSTRSLEENSFCTIFKISKWDYQNKLFLR